MDYNDSSRPFRPLGSRVMALSIKCVSLTLRTESREEWTFPNEINCMSLWEWSEWERKCSETLVGLDLMLVLSDGRLCSLNLSLRQKWPNCVEDSVGVNIFSRIKITIALIWLPVLVWSLLELKILNLSQYLRNKLLMTKSPLRVKQMSPKRYTKRYKQKPQLQSVSIFFKFVHPCLLLYSLCYLYLLFMFLSVIFMFHSVWWWSPLFEFWQILCCWKAE